MTLLMLLSEFSPSEAARYMTENYGYAVSASVIVKWDNLILRKERPKQRGEGKFRRRMYDLSDISLFNGIAIMRSLGYSIGEISQLFSLDLHNPRTRNECLAFIDSVKAKIMKQRKGLELYDSFFDALKVKNKRLMRSRSWKP